MARLREIYNNEINDAMVKKFGYKNPMEIPKLEKIVINMIEGNRQKISQELDKAKEAGENARQITQTLENMDAESRSQCDEILVQARERSKRSMERSVEESRLRADSRLKEAEHDVTSLKQQALTQLRDQSAESLVQETGKLLFKAGDTKVNGDTAEIILRNRGTVLADYDRLELQQSFYAAVFRTFMEQYPVGDALQVAKNVAVYLDTDLSVMDLMGIYLSMKELQAEDIYVVRCSGGPVTVNGQGLYGVEKENTARILNEHFRPEGVTVSADKLGLPDVEFTLGYNVDEGKHLSEVETAEIKD